MRRQLNRAALWQGIFPLFGGGNARHLPRFRQKGELSEESPPFIVALRAEVENQRREDIRNWRIYQNIRAIAANSPRAAATYWSLR